MSKNTANIRSYSDGKVYVAPLGSVAPTTLGAFSAAWTELGWISDKGVTEATKISTTDVKAWQNGTVVRKLKTDWGKDFQCEALEENLTVMSLLRPGSPISRGSGTNEVQTITMTATGGTFVVSFGGATTPSQAFNVATATLQTALQALVTVGSGNVTVTGTAGTSYVLTFTGSLAARDVSVVTLDASALTGGSATVATTTPGVAALVSTNITPFLGQDLRAFAFDLYDGPVTKRLICPVGEADFTGNVVNDGKTVTIYPFTIVAYPDVNGVAVYEISNNPAL